jgi:multidrug efflux pump subunit AcrA (membrane-fusion protein)
MTSLTGMGRAASMLLLTAVVGTGCRAATPDASAAENAKTTGTPPVVVRLVPIAEGPVDRPIFGTGTLRQKSEADLSFKVGGVVAAVLVEEGARVKKGQVLARLDPTEVDAALRQTKEGARKADRDLERVRRLHASGALPIAELQNAETAASTIRAAVDAATFNAQRSVIVAPDDGRVDRKMVEPGEVVAPGRAVFHVSGRSKGAVVRLGLVDRDALRVREGDDARVMIDALPNAPLHGTLTQIATVATPGVGTFDVEVRLDSSRAEGASRVPPAADPRLPPPGVSSATESLLSGLTAKVEIRRAEQVAGVVPIGALVEGRGTDAAVFVVDQGRAKRVPVKVAFLLDGRAALGVAPEPRTMVVEAGASQLEDGSPVRVLP